jgi:hypothetical protein
MIVSPKARAGAQASSRLTRTERKVLKAIRRLLAKQLAADCGLPFDQVFNSIVSLEKRGLLVLQYDAEADRFSLEPAISGQSLDDLLPSEGRQS